ncbi:hypothetical protein [Escherichia coli]|uniref:hypothetical protein n=1 Tax=Escherichia coli TaxID=562 RepID=UPI0004D6CBA9|nr:hypothetical protein [Escherichia coli]KDT76803.1 hypothetical protein AC59_0162 [Escherichia coli 3-373-03_S3_C3]KDU11129.1 hypothetical protein AC34_2344 [Escherichia coli 3-373-03_S3_C2]
MRNSLAVRFSLQQGEELSQEYQVIKYEEAPEQVQIAFDDQHYGNAIRYDGKKWFLNPVTNAIHVYQIITPAISDAANTPAIDAELVTEPLPPPPPVQESDVKPDAIDLTAEARECKQPKPEQQTQDNKQWHGNTAYLNTFACHLHEVLPQAIYNTWCDKQTASHFHLLYALCYLASYENKDEGIELGEVLYGAEKIATGGVVPGFKLSRKTFDAKINDLEAWGLIKVTRGKKRKDGQGNSPNRIKLSFKPYSSK